MLSVRDLSARGIVTASFDLPPGACFALRGPSGSGKTLLLRAIADLDPAEGEVLLDGRPRALMDGPDWRRRVVYLAAEPGWWAERVDQHFPDWPSALPMAEALGLSPDMGRRPVAELSTGQRQRLVLVRALARGPQVLLLDEPTSALDEDSRDRLESLIKAKQAQGLAVLWVSHDPAQAARVASHSLVLEGGRVRAG
ncbi:ATP-binding cassette domain-containing protein [Telmatospirillum sp. J64-1]|uniref:ABC transporter ATP-binding protein n=1 Tax=Telmatospirillum sp. J64-1 TaxID=2502183 RepID=UPI00115CDFF7|nr:ABC transporter ATP-binding protein [Telmatospirillum sp. J64-1]